MSASEGIGFCNDFRYALIAAFARPGSVSLAMSLNPFPFPCTQPLIVVRFVPVVENHFCGLPTCQHDSTTVQELENPLRSRSFSSSSFSVCTAHGRDTRSLQKRWKGHPTLHHAQPKHLPISSAPVFPSCLEDGVSAVQRDICRTNHASVQYVHVRILDAPKRFHHAARRFL